MNKYNRFSTVTVLGYIVNHTDNLNFDIWFDFESVNLTNLNLSEFNLGNESEFPSNSDTSELDRPIPDKIDTGQKLNEKIGKIISDRYFMVHKEPFTYTDVQINNCKLESSIKYNKTVGIIPTGLIKNGISYRCRLKKIDAVKPVNDILHEVATLIYYHDGWVLCDISDVDIYNRLLVEIYDVDRKYSINNLLLNNYSHFFKHYPSNSKYPTHGNIVSSYNPHNHNSINYACSTCNSVYASRGKGYFGFSGSRGQNRSKFHNRSDNFSWKKDNNHK